MNIFSPSTEYHFQSRHKLLMQALRSPQTPFAIELEYPLVLAESETAYSFCLGMNEQIVAHANFFPRQLTNEETKHRYPVALIGNVATDPRWRGQGCMQRLFSKLEELAREQGINALILWSDLYKFYQNLGFSSLGRELRFFFKTRKLLRAVAGGAEFFALDPESLTTADIEVLMAQRLKTPFTLERSPDEFRRLLSIPATLLFAGIADGKLASYFIIGKGCDMVGVVHEWGAATPELALKALAFIGSQLGYEDTILLTPGALEPDWQNELKSKSENVEEHAMALAKVLPGAEELRKLLPQTFIWGLDSI